MRQPAQMVLPKSKYYGFIMADTWYRKKVLFEFYFYENFLKKVIINFKLKANPFMTFTNEVIEKGLIKDC